MEATQIVLASRPKGTPTADNFRFEKINLPELKDGEVLLEPVYMSVDPYMRGRMNDAKSYTPPFQVDAPIEGGTVAKVIESKSDVLKPGDMVQGFLPWATNSIGEA